MYRSPNLIPKKLTLNDLNELQYCHCHYQIISKSARYGPRTGNSSRKSKEKELWNPEMAAAQLIGLQLQNPHAAQQNLLGLIGGQQTPQLFPRQFRKTSGQGQMSMDLDLGVGERKGTKLLADFIK